MKISQKEAILIKKYLSVKAVWWTNAVEWISRLGLKTWKHDSLLKRICKTGTIIWQQRSGRPRSARNNGRPPVSHVQSGGQTNKALISSRDFAWNCHSQFKCAQDSSPQSPAQMLQTTSCSAVVWSQSHLLFHTLINNLLFFSSLLFGADSR